MENVREDNLVSLIINDFLDNKLVILLLFIVMLTAVGVVYSSYMNRTLSSSWDQLLQERDNLDTEWRNLLLEEQSLAEHSRVSRIAKDELKMHRELPRNEIKVIIP